MTPLILLIIGLLLIFIEFFIPGAVMGIAGGIFLFISLVLFALSSDSPWATAGYTLFVFAALIILIRFALWRIVKAKPERSILSRHSQEGYQASSYDASLIGKKGIVVTDLKPGGHVLIEGKRVQAISQSGYIVKGEEIFVIGGQEESLIVKHVKKEH